MMSVTIMPPQAVALGELMRDVDGAVGMEVAQEGGWHLRVAVYTSNPDDSPEAPPASARWFTVSCAGSVREVCPDPEQVAA